MSTQTRWPRAAAATAAVVSALFLGASPASAKPAPEPTDQQVSVWTCPTRIDAVAGALRADGFSAQAAKNIAVLSQRDCIDNS